MQLGSCNRLGTAPAAAPRGSRQVQVHVATPSTAPTSRLAKRSKVEIIKEQSDFLRHPLMEELVNDKTFISEPAMQVRQLRAAPRTAPAPCNSGQQQGAPRGGTCRVCCCAQLAGCRSS